MQGVNVGLEEEGMRVRCRWRSATAAERGADRCLHLLRVAPGTSCLRLSDNARCL